MPAMTLRQSMDRFPAAKVLNKHFAGKYLRGVREIMDEELWGKPTCFYFRWSVNNVLMR